MQLKYIAAGNARRQVEICNHCGIALLKIKLQTKKTAAGTSSSRGII